MDRLSVWRDWYLFIQGFFYLAQGIAMGVIVFFPSYLRDLGVEEFWSIVFQAIVALPWGLKIIFGIVSDNVKIGRYGRRKPYIIFAGISAILGWITLPLYTSFSYLILVSGTFVSLAIAVSDATLDALAVDITPEERHGLMQGVGWGFRGLGIGATAVVAGRYADAGDWTPLFIFPGIMTALACILIVLVKENPLPPDFQKVPKEKYKEVFSHRSIHYTMIFQFLSGAGLAIVAIMQTFLEEELNYSNKDIGWILLFFSIGMFSGALLFGLFGDMLSLERVLPFITIGYSIMIGTVFLFDLRVFSQVSVFFGLIGFMNGGYEANQMRLGMDYAPTVLGGTMFNLYNSLSNIGQFALGSIIIGLIATQSNYEIGWQAAWIFMLVALIPAIRLIREFDPKRVAIIGSLTDHQNCSYKPTHEK